MNATFTHAIRYWVTAACLTPLRTGAADGSVDDVLRDWAGQAFVQGSSVAGALREWLKLHDPARADLLFGSEQAGGSLMVSHAWFEADAEQQSRPRLRINGSTGTADDGGKFDIAHIAPGTKLHFELVLLEQDDNSSSDCVEQMLAALHAGVIRLGAQKTNGFGRVALAVNRRVYHMTDAADRQAWLENREDGTPFELPALSKQGQVVFTVCGQMDSILVKSGSPERRQTADAEPHAVTTALREGNAAILPGSSVKGVVRARAEAIADLLGLRSQLTASLFGREAQQDDNGQAGKVCFEDVRLSDQKREITRIRINKFTGGVIRKGLFVEEPLCSEVELRITLPAAEEQGCGLLLFALRDLGLGLYNLGSGGAVGRGYLQVAQIQAQAPDGCVASLRFDQNRTCTIEDNQGLFARWMEQLRRDGV